MFTKVIENLILIGKSGLKFQKIYENLFQISLLGMNIGTGDNILSDGEIFVMHYVRNKCSLNKDTIIFDVGANVGNYSQKIVKEFTSINFQLYSFEPSKETFFELKKSLKNIPDLKLYNIGFGEESGIKTLFYNKKKSGLASMYNRRLSHFGIKMNLTELIELKTLDNFCEENKIKKIDFLKLDVEGNEFNVLEGAKKMINRNEIRIIQFEFGGCNIDSRTYFQDFWYLLSPKYRIYRILKNDIVEIPKYKEVNEIFVTTNYLAILR